MKFKDYFTTTWPIFINTDIKIDHRLILLAQFFFCSYVDSIILKIYVLNKTTTTKKQRNQALFGYMFKKNKKAKFRLWLRKIWETNCRVTYEIFVCKYFHKRCTIFCFCIFVVIVVVARLFYLLPLPKRLTNIGFSSIGVINY